MELIFLLGNIAFITSQDFLNQSTVNNSSRNVNVNTTIGNTTMNVSTNVTVLDTQATTFLSDPEAPIEPEIDVAAAALVKSSKCFASVQGIIVCMNKCEQNAWVAANKANKNSLKCFDCGMLAQSIKECVKRNVNVLAIEKENEFKNQRRGVSCFELFSEEKLDKYNDKSAQDLISEETEIVIRNQKEHAQGSCKLLQGFWNVMITRRKYLCANVGEWKSMANFQNNTIQSFFFTKDQATQVVQTFMDYCECKASKNAKISNAIQSITDAIANTETCLIPDNSTNFQEIFTLPAEVILEVNKSNVETIPLNQTSSPTVSLS